MPLNYSAPLESLIVDKPCMIFIFLEVLARIDKSEFLPFLEQVNRSIGHCVPVILRDQSAGNFLREEERLFEGLPCSLLGKEVVLKSCFSTQFNPQKVEAEDPDFLKSIVQSDLNDLTNEILFLVEAFVAHCCLQLKEHQQ